VTRSPAGADIDLSDVGPFGEGRQHELFRILRAEDPLHWNRETDGPGFWSLTRYEDVRAAAADHQRLSSAYGTQIGSKTVEGPLTSLHNMDPPRHSKLRRIAVPYLRSVKVRQWRSVIDETVDELLSGVIAQGDVDLVGAVAAPLPILVLGRVIGVPRSDSSKVVEWIQYMIDTESNVAPAQVEQARENFADYFHDLTRRRRQHPEEDLVSVLAQAQVDDQPLSWDDTMAYLSLFVAAGIETTRNLISGSVIALNAFPQEWDAMCTDKALLEPAVEEMLRWVTPLACMRRTATAEITWHDKTIQSGDKVVLWFNSANRDETVFRDPERFSVRRFAGDDSGDGQVAFGWGIHFCMGAHLAREEMYSLYREVMRGGLSITPTGQPARLQSNMFQGYKSLPVRIDKDAAPR
jgi:cytochrome P450